MSDQKVTNLRKDAPASRFRFDYKGRHRYLISLAVFGGKEIFSSDKVVFEVLNVLRESATNFQFDVIAYCFLPERLEMFVRGKESTSDLKKFLMEFRVRSAKVCEKDCDHQLWKRKYTERVLRKQEDTRSVALQFNQLPVKAGLVKNADAYPFKGSFTFVPSKPPR